MPAVVRINRPNGPGDVASGRRANQAPTGGSGDSPRIGGWILYRRAVIGSSDRGRGIAFISPAARSSAKRRDYGTHSARPFLTSPYSVLWLLISRVSSPTTDFCHSTVGTSLSNRYLARCKTCGCSCGTSKNGHQLGWEVSVSRRLQYPTT